MLLMIAKAEKKMDIAAEIMMIKKLVLV